MKLYARTPAGFGLGLDVLLTGQLTEANGKIRSVEVSLPIGCDSIIGYRVEVLPQTATGRRILWADPGDLCGDDGNTVTQDQLRAEAARAKEQLRREVEVGPLGENWP